MIFRGFVCGVVMLFPMSLGCGVVVSPSLDGATTDDAAADAPLDASDDRVVVEPPRDAAPLGPLSGRVLLLSRFSESATDDYYLLYGSIWSIERGDVTMTSVGGCRHTVTSTTIQYRSAGALDVRWDGQQRTAPSATNGYMLGVAQPVPRAGDEVRIRASGQDAPGFEAALIVPPVPTVTEPTGPDVPQPLPPNITVRWLPNNDPGLELRVVLSWVESAGGSHLIHCVAPASVGRMDVPAEVMALLRPLPRRRMRVSFARTVRVPMGAESLEFRLERAAGFATYE
jgi:hypothetical protein